MLRPVVPSLILLGFSLLLGCALPKAQPQPAPASPAAAAVEPSLPTAAERVTPPAAENPAPEPPATLTLMAVGDIMGHQEQLDAAWNPKTQSYEFAPFFQKVAPLLQQADWVVGNLETTLAGKAARYAGYPQFNTPESLADTLREVGFTAVTTANNHSLDRREAGVLATLDQLDRVGLLHTGTFRSPEEREQPLVLEKEGIRMAVLAYTYGTNGIPLPKGKPWLVNLIQPERMKADIARARALGVELVMVSLHFGGEYQRQPNAAQKKAAELCLQAGADLIIGHHPHVVQPYEWRTVTLPDGTLHTGFVAYSLGNFISAQRGDYKDVGAILQLTIVKQGKETKIAATELIPTYVHFYRKAGKRHYVIYPLPQTLAADAPSDPLLSPDLRRYMARLLRETSVHVAYLESAKQKQ